MRANLLAAYNYHTAFTYPVSSTLLDLARKLYRVPAERARPDGERLAEYRDSARPELELALFSAEPTYDDLEQLQLTHWLTILKRYKYHLVTAKWLAIPRAMLANKHAVSKWRRQGCSH